MTYTPAQQRKIHLIMHEFKHKALRQGSAKGKRVTDRRQAIAIAMRQAGVKAKAKSGPPPRPSSPAKASAQGIPDAIARRFQSADIFGGRGGI